MVRAGPRRKVKYARADPAPIVDAGRVRIEAREGKRETVNRLESVNSINTGNFGLQILVF